MPEMNSLTVNGVKYDLRDSTAARTRLPYIYAGTGGEQFYQVCKATMSSTWTRAFATFIFTNAYAGTRFTAVVAARVIRGSDIVVEYDQIAGKNIADRLYYYMDTVNSTVYFYYHKPTNEEWYVTSLNQDGSMTAEIQPIGASLAAYTGKAIYELGASAPAGFGLGTHATAVSDFNEATATGWYSGTTSTANKPFGYSLVHVINRNGTEILQIGYDMASTSSGSYAAWTSQIRRRSNNVWSEWEYVNPPMYLGVEYRTTERLNGKAVYTKAIECGALGANSIDDVSHNTTNIEAVWVSGGYWFDGALYYSLPYFGTSDNQVLVSAYASVIHRQLLGSAYNIQGMVVVLKYTKTTG